MTKSMHDQRAVMQVHRRPRVGVLSTGDELCEPSTSQLGPGQIRDANRAMLLAAASEAGAEVVDFGIARDRQEDVNAAFQRVEDSAVDLLLTSGAHACVRMHCVGRLMIKSWSPPMACLYVCSPHAQHEELALSTQSPQGRLCGAETPCLSLV